VSDVSSGSKKSLVTLTMEESVTALDFAPFSAEQYDFLPFFFFFFLTKVNSSLCLFSKSYLLAIGLENGAIQLLKVAKKDYSTEPFSTIPKWYFFKVASLLFALSPNPPCFLRMHHSATVKKLTWKTSSGNNTLQLASCGLDHSVRIFSLPL